MKIYDLFISHAWKYNDEYYRLERLLNEYNYFAYNNLNFKTYDFETVKPAILSQAGQKYVQLRFDSYRELLAAERDLLTDGKIFKIFPEAKSYQRYISESKLQLYIFLNDYYLN